MQIRYKLKSTRAKCQYVTIHPDDMPTLITLATVILAEYAENTADPKFIPVVRDCNAKLWGRRGETTYAPFKDNNRLSLLGGVISNYYSKQNSYRNDLTVQQLPYLQNVINERATALQMTPIVFVASLF